METILSFLLKFSLFNFDTFLQKTPGDTPARKLKNAPFAGLDSSCFTRLGAFEKVQKRPKTVFLTFSFDTFLQKTPGNTPARKLKNDPSLVWTLTVLQEQERFRKSIIDPPTNDMMTPYSPPGVGVV